MRRAAFACAVFRQRQERARAQHSERLAEELFAVGHVHRDMLGNGPSKLSSGWGRLWPSPRRTVTRPFMPVICDSRLAAMTNAVQN